jgi:dihydroorotase
MILKNVMLANGEVTDVEIQEEFISGIKRTVSSGLDCDGLVLLPGLVDLHAHLRQPGFEESETVLTGSRSAAAGGYTALFAMANTQPTQDSVEIVESVTRLGEQAGLVKVQPIGAITKNIAGKELAPLAAMAASAANVRMFSDDGNCLMDVRLMREALLEVKKFGGVIAQHAQNHHQTIGAQMNEGSLSVELGLGGWPRQAEEEIIARDAELAIETGSRLHICHVTTAGGVDVIRWAKAKGAKITAEVTPHHLLLNEELVRSYDPVYKVNPPLRTEEDTKALRQGLLDGVIDVLATDHAPHSKEKKECEWPMAAFGMVGLEVAASVLFKVLILDGGADWNDFSRVSSLMPSKIGGLPGTEYPSEGSKADLVLFDPSAARVVSKDSYSLSANNPWAGLSLPGRVVHTIFRGKMTVRDGELVG